MGNLLRVADSNRCIGCYSCMFACARLVHNSFSPRLSSVQVRTQGGMQGRFSINACRGCLQPICQSVCKTGALLIRKGGGVTLEQSLCSGCGNCTKACPIGALPFEEGMPVVCRHCGLCAEFCPHGVLSIEDCKEELC